MIPRECLRLLTNFLLYSDTLTHLLCVALPCEIAALVHAAHVTGELLMFATILQLLFLVPIQPASCATAPSPRRQEYRGPDSGQHMHVHGQRPEQGLLLGKGI